MRDHAPVMASSLASGTVSSMKRVAPSRRRRGVAILYFIGIGIPMALAAFAVSVDVVTLVGMRRTVQLAAESASVAAAFQYKTDGSGGLDDARARAVAEETCQVSVDKGAIPSSHVQLTGQTTNWCKVSIRQDPVTGKYVSVGVTIEYTPKGLVVLPVLDYLFGGNIVSGLTTVPAVEAAAVCDPSKTTVLYCPRPGTGSGGFSQTRPGEVLRPAAPTIPNAENPWTGNNQFYPFHYPGHYPRHYPVHYSGHYPVHYSGHYPVHYSGHYPGQYYPPNNRRY